jgi:hypothetical protein
VRATVSAGVHVALLAAGNRAPDRRSRWRPPGALAVGKRGPMEGAALLSTLRGFVADRKGQTL